MILVEQFNGCCIGNGWRKMINPLVTVVVITYNSAAFILETLNSIREQTYSNLELVISDDHSKDDTVEICRQWLKGNKDRFVRTELLTTEKNTGISGNANRGYGAAQGEWIKGIAGDDILLPHCIATCMKYTETHPEHILMSYLQEFGDGDSILRPPQGFETINNACRQLENVLTKDFYVGAPSMFCRKSLWQSIGGFDEQYPLFEDFPFIVRVLQKDSPVGIIPEILVHYRIHTTSASRTSGTDGFSASFRLWRRQILIPMLWSHHHYCIWWHHKLLLWRTDPARSQWIRRYPIYLFLLLLDPIALREQIVQRWQKLYSGGSKTPPLRA